jgi:phosphate ABC transporter permease subunit PstA
MVRFNLRTFKNTLFKTYIYGFMGTVLILFAILFSFVFFKGISGFFDYFTAISVNFQENNPQQTFKIHEEKLTPGALKSLYELHKQAPHYRGILKLPSHSREGIKEFNPSFLTQGNSAYPESAGILSALMGTIYVLCISMTIGIPFGVCGGVYLEELAPRNKIFRLLEVILSNLAAVPSILYGLLGLILFIHFLHIPRSSSLVGGLTLALMSLPALVVGTRLALKTVPKSIRDSAQALGASPLQVTFHHVVPMAFPSITTSILMSMARVCGETAPLLIVGLTAFYPKVPQSIEDPAVTLPVQIYMWSRHPDPAFIAKGAAGILVLGLFLGLLTFIALKIRGNHDTKRHP